MHPLDPKIDRIKVIFYNNFYESHEELFKRNPIQYHKEAHKDVESRLINFYNDKSIFK